MGARILNQKVKCGDIGVGEARRVARIRSGPVEAEM